MPRGPRLPRGAPSSRHANADGHLRRTHRYLPGRVVNERGSVTAFVVIMTSALLAMAGLVIDGGYALAAHRRALNEAEAAVTAGAPAVQLDTLTATGDVLPDAEGSEQRALAYPAALDWMTEQRKVRQK